jgi:hypothetical protein
MAQSLAKIDVHVVFGTKNREPLLVSAIRNELFAYIVGIFEFVGMYYIGNQRHGRSCPCVDTNVKNNFIVQNDGRDEEWFFPVVERTEHDNATFFMASRLWSVFRQRIAD